MSDWIDRHPWLAGLVQLGIYALCWAGILACLALAAFLFALLAVIGP
jgi:hypothetical protein